jgi:hypothetical protein
MGAKGYTTVAKHEAIVLGSIIGADAAGLRLKIDPRTIRSWMTRAGRTPADAISAADWSGLGELARAQVASDLASGKVTTIQAATIAGIASRNVREAPPHAEPLTSAEQWADDLEAALVKAYGKLATIAMVAVIVWMESGDPEGEAASVPAVMAHVASLDDLHEWRRARCEQETRETAEQLARNRVVAEEWQRKALDAETQAILDEAERWLAQAKP